MVSTKTKILDTAEELFAEQGFENASMRNITTRAAVNLSAVNYHFGSKKVLIQSVFERFLTPFFTRFNLAYSELEEQQLNKDIDAVLNTITKALLADDIERATRFLHLLRLAYNEQQGHLRRFIKESYGSQYVRLISGLRDATNSDLPPLIYYWRLQFMMGAAMFTLPNLKALQAISQFDLGVHSDNDVVINEFHKIAKAIVTAE